MSTVAEPLERGRAAVARHAWAEAFELLRAADGEGALEPRDLEALAETAWWAGDLDACIDARERAFVAFTNTGDPRRAALVAMELAKNYYAKGASSIGTAWVKRAERTLEPEPECAERGWLHRLRSVIALEGGGDYETALAEARRARELGERFPDVDLMAIALHDEGRALVMSGDVEAGLALIDEATAPATAGELTPFTTAVVYCNTITACKELADYRRAGEWSDAAKRWCERQAIAGFPGMCRVYRASIMALRGAWPEAELEAQRATEELPSFNRSYAAEAFYELGAIRFRAGDLDAAEEAFRHAHELGREPQPGVALLRLAHGRIEGARSCIDQALQTESADLHRARLLPALVEIALADGDADAARRAAEELAAIAQRFGSEALDAAARTAAAMLASATGDPGGALAEARRALRAWQSVDAPYEAAQARLVLADGYTAVGDVETASLELEAALATFERLGAVRDARSVRERLARVGATGPGAAATRAKRTFMFTDIERSTNLVEAIGDEAWADLVAWHDKALRSLFAEYGGEEVDHAGDGFFVAFDDATAAVSCAVAIQRRLAEHRRTQGFAPQVRVGLHATEATRHGNAFKGRGVHEAARVGGLAHGGEIVATVETVAAAGTDAAVSEPRRVELKGIERPVEVVSVSWR
jgi:class 3 adenylate cyclase/Tfp pilus assembly protein PilF